MYSDSITLYPTLVEQTHITVINRYNVMKDRQ